jgi:hypothetical protein
MNNQERNNGYKCFPNLVLEGGLVEPFVKLNVQETLFGEYICLFQDIGFIPLFKQRKLLLWKYTSISKHLQLLYEHLRLQVHIIINLDFFQKNWT